MLLDEKSFQLIDVASEQELTIEVEHTSSDKTFKINILKKNVKAGIYLLRGEPFVTKVFIY